MGQVLPPAEDDQVLRGGLTELFGRSGYRVIQALLYGMPGKPE